MNKGTVMKHRLISASIITGMLLFASPHSAFAHIVVLPDEVKTGDTVTFNFSVHSEKAVPTTSLRLIIPDGLKSVRPYIKPDWKIELKKQGDPENPVVKEILWSGGSIPTDLKDEFTFSAKTPVKATTLSWKVYQTYADGSVVSWVQTPDAMDDEEHMDMSNTGPASLTKVIEDRIPSPSPQPTTFTIKNPPANQWINCVAYVSLALSIVSLVLAIRKSK